MSVNKDAVAGIKGTSQQSDGLARPQVAPAPKSGERRRQRQEDEAEEFLVEIGEEARHSLRKDEAAAAFQETDKDDTEEKGGQGVIVDVVV